MYAKCPKCEELVTRIDAAKVDLIAPNGKTLHGVTFACSRCQTVLGAGMDPVALARDLADLIRQR